MIGEAETDGYLLLERFVAKGLVLGGVMFRYEDFLIITLIILLIVYILGKTKHIIELKVI